jgi:hypothetical protein
VDIQENDETTTGKYKGKLYGVGGVFSQSVKSLPGAPFREAVLFNKLMCGSVYHVNL